MNDIAEHKAAIAEAKVAAETVTQGTRTELDNNLIKSDRGPTIRNLLKRLARDAPEMLDKIEAGQLTVNAAAIQADQKKVQSLNLCQKAMTTSRQERTAGDNVCNANNTAAGKESNDNISRLPIGTDASANRGDRW